MKVSVTLPAECNREASHSSSNNGSNLIITIDLSPLTSLITHFQLHAELSYQTVIWISVAIIAINLNLNRHRIQAHTTAQHSKAKHSQNGRIKDLITQWLPHLGTLISSLVNYFQPQQTHTVWHAKVCIVKGIQLSNNHFNEY